MLFVLGLLLWSGLHLTTVLAVDARARVVARLGKQPYRGLFSLAMVMSLTLIVVGWRSMPPTLLWLPPAGMRHVTMALVPIAVILFLSSRMPSDVRRWVRHPQLTGVKLWAVAHLLSNGETRAVLLFGGLLAWAVVEVILLSRRDGAWVKPEAVGLPKTLASIGFGILVAVVLVFAHPYFTGRQLLA